MSKNYKDIRDRAKAKRRTRGLIVSYNCNLSCVYCYIQNKSFTHPAVVHAVADNSYFRGKIMPIEIAQNAIEDIFKEGNTDGYDEVEIDFVGAEPLTVYKNLKQISEWLWSKEWPKPYILFATTNGTLLNNEMKEWFHKNRERFVLGLSCDGDADTHNKNRSESALSIDFDFFLKTWPTQPIKMTISEDRVAYLEDDVIYLHEKGFSINANPANGMNAWRESNIAEYGRQLLRLMDYYLGNPTVPRASLFAVNLAGVLNTHERMGKKYCGAGDEYDVIDVDGKKYPCHMFSPLVLPQSKITLIDKINFGVAESFEDKMCKGCILKKICPSCYGLNFKQHGSPAIHDKTLCKLFIIQALANCKFHSRLLCENDSISFEKFQIVQATKMIYDYFYRKDRK